MVLRQGPTSETLHGCIMSAVDSECRGVALCGCALGGGSHFGVELLYYEYSLELPVLGDNRQQTVF